MTASRNLIQDEQFSEFKRKFGKQLQYLRKQKDLSQEQLASLVGKDRVSIGYYEQGRMMSSYRSIIKIAGALEIGLCDIFEPFGKR